MRFFRTSSNKLIIVYGLIFAIAIVALRWLEVRFIIMQHNLQAYFFLISALFLFSGVWLASRLIKPKIIETPIKVNITSDFKLNTVALERLGLSNRELEVLQLMARGKSNQEIADQLFISLNTVKTHGSRLFEKMQVKRRTQAVDTAKKLSIIS
ncbi:MAG: response regulator transcription factor [Pedobacter sp.]|nr:MAG: response regulator transcription factor [Pedobacter sp.]